MSERDDIGLSAALDAVLDALDKCAMLALHPDTRPIIAAEEMRLGAIICRAQVVLSFLETHKPKQPNLRIVK